MVMRHADSDDGCCSAREWLGIVMALVLLPIRVATELIRVLLISFRG